MHARQAKPSRRIGGGANRYGGLGCADECPSDAVAPLRADCGRPRMAVPPCGPPGTQPARCFTCRRVVGPQNEALKLCVSGPIVFSFVTCVERVCEAWTRAKARQSGVVARSSPRAVSAATASRQTPKMCKLGLRPCSGPFQKRFLLTLTHPKQRKKYPKT